PRTVVALVPYEPQAAAALPSVRRELEGTRAAGPPAVGEAVAGRLAGGPQAMAREERQERRVRIVEAKRHDVRPLDDDAVQVRRAAAGVCVVAADALEVRGVRVGGRGVDGALDRALIVVGGELHAVVHSTAPAEEVPISAH